MARLRWKLRPLLTPAFLYMASRVATVTAFAIAANLSDAIGFGDAFNRWDSEWYLSVASQGYPHGPLQLAERSVGNTAFFPLFPVLIRGTSELTGLSPFLAGVLLTSGLGLLATLLLWVLAQRLYGTEVANRTAALFCFFPGSFVASMVYSEPLMLVLAVSCMLALLCRRWVLAGVAAALATASRPNALVLLPCCLWEAGKAIRERREWRALMAPFLAPVGMAAFFGFLWVRQGEPFTWFRVQQEVWDERFDFGLTTAVRLLELIRDPSGDINVLIATLGLLFFVSAGFILVRSRPPVIFLVYTVGIGFLSVGSALGLRPRFVWTAFPIFIALARRLRDTSNLVLVGTSAALLTGLAMLSVATQGALPSGAAIP